MIATAKDLRFNISMLFDALGKGEDITITYRGKAKAKLVSTDKNAGDMREDIAFGIWRDKDKSVDAEVRDMRRGRRFDI